MSTSVGLYHRVSTVDQNPKLAREELRAAAQARGLNVTLDVEETGSGARNDRPGLQRVLDAARRGQIKVVIAWKLDRFGRSALDLLSNIRVLEDAGVRFIATSQGIDIKPGGDPMSRLLLTMLAGVAEFERSLIVERTHLGLARVKAEGRALGRRVGTRRGGAKAPPGERGHAPDPAKVVELRAAGVAWRDLAEQLGCSLGAAQRAALRIGKGTPPAGSSPVEKRTA
jgi:DNA invertase Pin-like site-specific DNA recombinase